MSESKRETPAPCPTCRSTDPISETCNDQFHWSTMNHTVFLAQLSKRETPTPPDSIHPRREWVELAELREKLATAEAQNKRLAEALELIARYSLDESPQQTRIIAKNALAELEKQQ